MHRGSGENGVAPDGHRGRLGVVSHPQVMIVKVKGVAGPRLFSGACAIFFSSAHVWS
jgi:hypothetical protein